MPNLPDWIKFNQAKGHYVLLQPCKCQRCDGDPWYPRIKYDGTLKLNTCPHCKTTLWNVPKRQKIKNVNEVEK